MSEPQIHVEVSGATDRETTRSAPRVGVLTARGFHKEAYRSALYEAEDILAEVADADLLHLTPLKNFKFWTYWHRRLMWHDFTGKLRATNPGFNPIKLEKEYDLLVIVCQDWREFFYINAIRDWKDHCKVSVCYIDEMWRPAIPICEYILPSLNMFDHVVLGFHQTVAPLSRILGRPCHFVSSGVDAARFSPCLKDASRPIDVFSMGRRNDNIHRSLMGLASQSDLFYLYDVAVEESAKRVLDHREHRESFANLAKRSRCFMVAPAKMGDTEVTGDQVEVGFRFFEGAAAGAVLVGQAPKCESFRQMFDWPDAVVELKEDGSDTDEVMRSLLSQPEELRRISHRNALESLLRHDWVYRWREIFDIAGVEPPPALLARELRLRELARSTDSEPGQTAAACLGRKFG